MPAAMKTWRELGNLLAAKMGQTNRGGNAPAPAGLLRHFTAGKCSFGVVAHQADGKGPATPPGP